MHELESYAASAQVLEGIGGVRSFGIQYGYGTRQHIVWHVVVADDEVYAQRLSIGNLVDSLDAAVEHDNQFHTFLCRIVESFLADAVSLLIAVGDVVFHIGIELLQKLVDKCNSRTSVDIIVAVYHNTLLSSHCVVETIDSHIHIVHQERVNQLVQHGSEESFGSRFCPDSAL